MIIRKHNGFYITGPKLQITTYMSMNKKTNTNNNMEFAAHSGLTRGLAGIVIKRLPELKATYPGIYVRYENGMWTVDRTREFKAVKDWIKAAELKAIADSTYLTEKVEEASCQGNADQARLLTSIIIPKLKTIELPEGAQRISFDNADRVWIFKATSQASLDLLIERFRELEAVEYRMLNPRITATVPASSFPIQGLKFTKRVIRSLKEVPLPRGSKRILFNYNILAWEFACQTEEDMEELTAAFDRHVMALVTAELTPEEPEKPVVPVREQALPTEMDFPTLTTNSVA